MFKITLASLGAHKRRLAAMFLSIFLGVAFLSGTLVLGDTLQSNFDTLFAEVNGGTDVVVRGDTGIDSDFASVQSVIDESIADDVGQVDGVANAVPYVEGYGRIIGAGGDALGGDGPPTLAANWIDDPALSPYRLVEGRAPEAANEVVINQGAADDGDLQIGDTTTILLPDPVEATITGIAQFGDEEGLGGVTMALFSLDTAQAYMTGDNLVTSVLVRADDGVSQEALRDSVRSVLPDGVEAITGQERTQQDLDALGDDFLDLFKAFLVVFAGIAMLVASFSIHNTFSILVAQRSRESALLRTVGASRRQILTWVVVEALLLGAVASIAGLFGGLGLAAGLKALFSGFGFALPSGGTVFQASTAVICLVVGIGVTLIAGASPAVKASRVAPLAVLREVNVDRTSASVVRAVAGALLLAGGTAIVLSSVVSGGGNIGQAGLGALLTILGVAVFGPVIARPAASALGAPLRLRGIAGSLARRNAMRNPRRTAGTAIALMVGVGVVTLFTVFAASIKRSIDESVSSSAQSDLVIQGDNFGSGALTPALATEITALDEVDVAAGIGYGSAILDGSSEDLTVVDPAAAGAVLNLDMTEGSLDGLAPNEIAVLDTVADDEGWEVGTPIEMSFADGASEQMTVGAIYEVGDLVGQYIIPRSTWERHVTQSVDATVLIALADGVDVEQGRAAVETVAERMGGFDVMTRDEFVDEVAGQVDQMLGLIYVMLFLAIVIALMGIANTLALAVRERTSEIGVLRAVGMTRRQVRSMVRWEAALVSVFGTLAGIAVGVFLGWALVRVTADDSGISAIDIPGGQLATIVVVGAIAGVLAGIRPARRAAKLDVLEAVATV